MKLFFLAWAALGIAAGCADPVTPPREFTCRADASWQNTGFLVHDGDRLTIEYENGQWTADTRDGLAPPAGNPHTPGLPTDALPSANRSALVGRLGDSVFLIGNRFDNVPPGAGRLYCAINTNISTADGTPYLRTAGAVTMRVRINRLDPPCAVKLPELCLF